MHTEGDVVPDHAVFHEDTRKERNELEEKDDHEHSLVEVDNFSLELLVDDFSDGGLLVEVIVSLLNDVGDDVDEFALGQEWFLDIRAHGQDFLVLNHIDLSLEHHGVEVDVSILNLE